MRAWEFTWPGRYLLLNQLDFEGCTALAYREVHSVVLGPCVQGYVRFDIPCMWADVMRVFEDAVAGENEMEEELALEEDGYVPVVRDAAAVVLRPAVGTPRDVRARMLVPDRLEGTDVFMWGCFAPIGFRHHVSDPADD